MELRELPRMCNLKMHVGKRSFRHHKEVEKERLEGRYDINKSTCHSTKGCYAATIVVIMQISFPWSQQAAAVMDKQFYLVLICI
jgi:hypothetical protein